jgi:hypothetical protein
MNTSSNMNMNDMNTNMNMNDMNNTMTMNDMNNTMTMNDMTMTQLAVMIVAGTLFYTSKLRKEKEEALERAKRAEERADELDAILNELENEVENERKRADRAESERDAERERAEELEYELESERDERQSERGHSCFDCRYSRWRIANNNKNTKENLVIPYIVEFLKENANFNTYEPLYAYISEALGGWDSHWSKYTSFKACIRTAIHNHSNSAMQYYFNNKIYKESLFTNDELRLKNEENGWAKSEFAGKREGIWRLADVNDMNENEEIIENARKNR